MFSHVMVGSNDIERSKRFYDALLGVLGVGEPLRNQNNTGQTRLFSAYFIGREGVMLSTLVKR
jgi:catechol 2,3-dioxygenase-like lactoylglutathione lyase family enzyme